MLGAAIHVGWVPRDLTPIAPIMGCMKAWRDMYLGDIAALLLPGEQALANAPANYLVGREEIGGAPVPDSPADAASDVAFGLPSSAVVDATSELLGGISLVGFPGSLAVSMRDQLDSVCELVVTNERILLAHLVTKPQRLEWQADRSQVAGITLAARFLQPARCLIAFTDGSGIAVSLGMFGAGAAKRVVAATS